MNKDTFKEWAWNTFANLESNGLFTLSRFLPAYELYRTAMIGPMLATIVNGRTRGARFNAQVFPAEYEYDALIRHLQITTKNEPAWCFYFWDHDGAQGQLADVWMWNPPYASQNLTIFESKPAEQSGAAHLGIVAESKSWMLLHNYQPYEYFEILFCSSENQTRELVRALGIDQEENDSA